MKLGKKKTMNTEMTLQIAPMASIFTVILVFLIKMVSNGSAGVSPSIDLTLPELKEALDFQDSLKIEIGRSQIAVSDRPVAELKDYEFDLTDVAENGGLKSVNQAIASEKEKALEVHNPMQDVLILADQKAPYKTLKRVIASASASGYQKVKLVVTKNQ